MHAVACNFCGFFRPGKWNPWGWVRLIEHRGVAGLFRLSRPSRALTSWIYLRRLLQDQDMIQILYIWLGIYNLHVAVWGSQVHASHSSGRSIRGTVRASGFSAPRELAGSQLRRAGHVPEPFLQLGNPWVPHWPKIPDPRNLLRIVPWACSWGHLLSATASRNPTEEAAASYPTTTKAPLEGAWMSTETKALKAEVESLRLRVQLLEERLEALEVKGEGRVLSGIPSESSGSFTVISSGTETQGSKTSLIATNDTEERLNLAKECGAFLRRSYRGENRGTSGRDRLKLANRLYVILADYSGKKFSQPKVTTSFEEVKTICKRGPCCGNAIFLGFATQWEAKLAVKEAGFIWPEGQWDGEESWREVGYSSGLCCCWSSWRWGGWRGLSVQAWIHCCRDVALLGICSHSPDRREASRRGSFHCVAQTSCAEADTKERIWEACPGRSIRQSFGGVWYRGWGNMQSLGRLLGQKHGASFRDRQPARRCFEVGVWRRAGAKDPSFVGCPDRDCRRAFSVHVSPFRKRCERSWQPKCGSRRGRVWVQAGSTRDGILEFERQLDRSSRSSRVCQEAEAWRRSRQSFRKGREESCFARVGPRSPGASKSSWYIGRSTRKAFSIGCKTWKDAGCLGEEKASAKKDRCAFRKRGRRRGGRSRGGGWGREWPSNRKGRAAADQASCWDGKEQARQGWSRRHFGKSRRRRDCREQLKLAGQCEDEVGSLQEVEGRFDPEPRMVVEVGRESHGGRFQRLQVRSRPEPSADDVTVVAGAPFPAPELCKLGSSSLAHSWHTRQLEAGQSRRSQSQMRSSFDGLRPSFFGRGVMAAGSRVGSRAPPSFLELPEQESPGCKRTSLEPIGGRAVLGASAVAPERPGLLCRKQEETQSKAFEPRRRKRRRQRSSGQSKERPERTQSKGEVEGRSQQGATAERGSRIERAYEHAKFEAHLPGSRASVVHANIFEECFSVGLSSRTPFGFFLRSMIAKQRAAEAAPRGQVWPMPLPYPEVHTRRRSRLKEAGQLKLGMNYVVAVLNWLHIGGKPSSWKASLRGLGTKLNKDQWKAVNNMQPLVAGWLEAGQIGPEDMGRAAARVESIEAVIEQLEVMAEEVRVALEGYRKGGKRREKKVERRNEFEEDAEVVGRLSASIEHAAKAIEPERLKFIGVPSFDPSPYLDYANREQYEKPIDNSIAISPEDTALPKVRVRCSKQNEVKLLEELDNVQRLALVKTEDVRMHLLNGMFCLPKDQQKDRMILDARRPNFAEASERRWIYSLGATSQLNHIHLEPGELLVMHAEDFREYYHCFKVPLQRRCRNGLELKVRPAAVRHLKCFEGWMEDEDWLIPCLDTMAMGDTNAVAFGQAAHLSVILRTNEFELSDFIALKQRPSRSSVKCGLMIDDFVILEVINKAEAPKLEEEQTEGRRRMLAVREAYKQAGLPRHEGKAVEQSTDCEFWGYQVDGKVGLARPSLKRLVPLSWIIAKVVKLGKCSVSLLEVLAGALVSAFQCRRRLMSTLDEIYAAQRGREKTDVIKLGETLKTELLTHLGVLPLAAVDLRLKPSDWLVCSDASSSCEAAVRTKVGRARTKEFQRHALQKGLWNRLISPYQAFAREKGLTVPEDELPEKVAYQMHPVWEEIVTGCKFEKLGKPKFTKSRRHINLKEIDAALDSEKAIGRAEHGSYYVHLQDSQVSLACFIKGRSSSKAVNNLLKSSIAEHVGNNTRGFYGYCRSALNPADDPTRKVPVRDPSTTLPSWWNEVANGEYELFDSFLRRHSVHPNQISELPDEAELLPDFGVEWRSSAEVKSDRGRERRKVQKVEAKASRPRAEPDPAPRSSTSERALTPNERTAISGTGEGEAERPKRAEVEESRTLKEENAGSPTAGEVERLDLLLHFTKSQFVYDRTRFANLEQALESGPGLLDCFSGARGFSKAFVKTGCDWALCFDLKHSPSEDLTKPETQTVLLNSLSSGVFIAMVASPVCASFSTAITPPWRTKLHPAGRPGLTDVQQAKIELGHEQLRFVLAMVRSCIEAGILFWVENPDQSWFWKQVCKSLRWDEILQNHGHMVGDFRLDQCRFGTRWRKRTRFRTNCHLRDTGEFCKCQRPHVILRGRNNVLKQNFTKLAESYPRKLCSYLAAAFAIDLGFKGKRRTLDLVGCAKLTGARVGEAQNPGPRLPVRRDRENIYDYSLLEPATVLIRAKFWKQFQDWIELNIGVGATENFVACPGLLVAALEAFGAESFASGMPLHYYRQLAVHVQHEFPGSKVYMGRVWNLVGRWQIAEPTQHRTPIPESVVKAIASLGLLWGWRRFSCTVLLCFYGICRIGELLKARRGDLLTPQDLLWEEPDVLYLRINVPKTRNRGAKVQYATCQLKPVVTLLCNTWQHAEKRDLLYGSTASSFRRRWDAILKHLGIEKKHRLTPGSLRGGGAVAAHKRGVGIQDLMWHMRLQHQKTLTYYLQETTAASVLPALSDSSRSKILLLRDAFEFLVAL